MNIGCRELAREELPILEWWWRGLEWHQQRLMWQFEGTKIKKEKLKIIIEKRLHGGEKILKTDREKLREGNLDQTLRRFEASSWWGGEGFKTKTCSFSTYTSKLNHGELGTVVVIFGCHYNPFYPITRNTSLKTGLLNWIELEWMVLTPPVYMEHTTPIRHPEREKWTALSEFNTVAK